MATSLEERNRQVDTLAGEASRVPIDDEPQAVVAAPSPWFAWSCATRRGAAP